MSAGTRKKFVDFHKILEDKIIDDFLPERVANEKLYKHRKSRKLLGKSNSKSKSHHSSSIKTFIGKKRKHDTHIGKDGWSNQSDHKSKSKSDNKNKEKSEHSNNNKKCANSNSKIFLNKIPQKDHFSAKGEYVPPVNFANLSTNHLNKKIMNNLQRRSKQKDKYTKMTRKEYQSILSQHREELASLGLDFPGNELEFEQEIHEKETRWKKEYGCSLVSDFSSLYLTLFDYTKFENSKPHKMIDYILNNDNNFLLNQSDKDKFEEMKKNVFNKNKLSIKETPTGVFKSLYEYFKTDFSVSVITKVFEKLNGAIQEYYDTFLNQNKETTSSNNLVGIYQNILQNQRENDNISFIFDKKDKFTYQSFLTERLKARNELLMEINDTEIIKSLVYLNNKGNRPISRPGKGKGDIKFVSLLKEKFETCENDANICEKDKKRLKMNVLGQKKFASFVRRKMNFLLGHYNYDCSSNDKSVDEHSKESQKRTFNKILELLIKHKEDDFDKILKCMKKYENTNPVLVKNIRSIWSTFKFLFYLKSLSCQDAVSKKVFYSTDDTFWNIILHYCNTNGFISPKMRFRTPRKVFSSDKKRNETNCMTSDIFSLSCESNKDAKFITSSNEKKAESNSSAIFECEKIKADIKTILLSKLEKREELFKLVKKEQNKVDKIANYIQEDMKDISNQSNKSEEKPKGNRSKTKKNDYIQTEEEQAENNSGHEINKTISLYSDITENVVIKPKTLRPSPGFNATSGNIIINNYYNIINQNITEPAAIALVQNLAQISNGESSENSSTINIVTYNAERPKK